MKIYNTLTRQKEELKTIEKNKVKMYVCGPTVYGFIHIGNARPICVYDVLRRYLTYKGYEVRLAQNFTDVDDKIIKKANAEGVSAAEISERYINEYIVDSKGLNALTPSMQPKVTENMDSIIAFIKGLCDKGFAYEANGDVYFKTAEFKDYGKLSHMPLEELEAGARVDVNDVKQNPMDFALWKAAKPNEPSWQSPWGEGRPGWHIECSAMVKSYLGDTIDIHCGGQDLIFPHHENEIAQSEALNGTPFANYWLHNGYINIDNKKMSKSLNNFFTTREIAEKYGYEPIRYLMLQAHYRSQINYTDEIIEACKTSLLRIYTCRDTLMRALRLAQDGELSSDIQKLLLSAKEQFIAAMEDDLNTADAISAIFGLVRDCNTAVLTTQTKSTLQAALDMLLELTGVLGLLYEQNEEKIPDEVMSLVQKRSIARANKDFALADKLRDDIDALGFAIEETRQGTKISKKS